MTFRDFWVQGFGLLRGLGLLGFRDLGLSGFRVWGSGF